MASVQMHLPAYAGRRAASVQLPILFAGPALVLSQLRCLRTQSAPNCNVRNTLPVNPAPHTTVTEHGIRAYMCLTKTIYMHMNNTLAESYHSLKLHTVLPLAGIALHMKPCAWQCQSLPTNSKYAEKDSQALYLIHPRRHCQIEPGCCSAMEHRRKLKKPNGTPGTECAAKPIALPSVAHKRLEKSAAELLSTADTSHTGYRGCIICIRPPYVEYTTMALSPHTQPHAHNPRHTVA